MTPSCRAAAFLLACFALSPASAAERPGEPAKAAPEPTWDVRALLLGHAPDRDPRELVSEIEAGGMRTTGEARVLSLVREVAEFEGQPAVRWRYELLMRIGSLPEARVRGSDYIAPDGRLLGSRREELADDAGAAGPPTLDRVTTWHALPRAARLGDGGPLRDGVRLREGDAPGELGTFRESWELLPLLDGSIVLRVNELEISPDGLPEQSSSTDYLARDGRLAMISHTGTQAGPAAFTMTIRPR